MKSKTNIAEKIKRAIGYVRVSTAEQAKEGVSLDVQREQIQKYCELKGFQLVDILEDAGKSGKNIDRPAFQRLISIVDKGRTDVIVVFKLDRAFRSLADAATLIESWKEDNISFHSIQDSVDTSSNAGEALFGLLSVFARLERQTIKERTSSAIAKKKEQGYRIGCLPFGYSVDEDKKLVKNADEQKTLSLISRWHKKGVIHKDIAGLLNERGIVTRKGTPWSRDRVRQTIYAHCKA